MNDKMIIASSQFDGAGYFLAINRDAGAGVSGSIIAGRNIDLAKSGVLDQAVGFDLSPNTWSHIAAVQNFAGGLPSFVEFFVNGVSIGKFFDSRPYGPSTGLEQRLGSAYADLSPFHGLVDEVQIYNRALSASEIQDIFNADSAGKCKTVPFYAFSAKVELTLGPMSSDDDFKVEGTFALGTHSNGINPLTENVSIQVGTFTATMPAGSFTQGGDGGFRFEGLIDGVALEVVVQPRGGGSFEFKAEGRGANLIGTGNQVIVKLTIGDDSGP